MNINFTPQQPRLRYAWEADVLWDEDEFVPIYMDHAYFENLHQELLEDMAVVDLMVFRPDFIISTKNTAKIN